MDPNHSHRRKTFRYQTDVTDEEWCVIEPHLPMANSNLANARDHQRYLLCDAVLLSVASAAERFAVIVLVFASTVAGNREIHCRCYPNIQRLVSYDQDREGSSERMRRANNGPRPSGATFLTSPDGTKAAWQASRLGCRASDRRSSFRRRVRCSLFGPSDYPRQTEFNFPNSNSS